MAIGGSELFLILIVLLFFLTLPVIALVDILRSKFEGNNKLIWVVVVIFLHAIGVILYYLIGRNQKIEDKSV